MRKGQVRPCPENLGHGAARTRFAREERPGHRVDYRVPDTLWTRLRTVSRPFIERDTVWTGWTWSRSSSGETSPNSLAISLALPGPNLPWPPPGNASRKKDPTNDHPHPAGRLRRRRSRSVVRHRGRRPVYLPPQPRTSRVHHLREPGHQLAWTILDHEHSRAAPLTT